MAIRGAHDGHATVERPSRAWLVERAYHRFGWALRLGLPSSPSAADAMALLTDAEADWVRRSWSGETNDYGCLLDVIERRFGPIIEPDDDESPPPLRAV